MSVNLVRTRIRYTQAMLLLGNQQAGCIFSGVMTICIVNQSAVSNVFQMS